MPIYEYVCRRCRREFEVLVRGSENPVCPHCAAVDIDRQMSVPSAHVASLESRCTVREMGACGGGGCGTGQCGVPPLG